MLLTVLVIDVVKIFKKELTNLVCGIISTKLVATTPKVIFVRV